MRERGEDIEQLTQYFLQRACAIGATPQLDDAARDALVNYDFPGNVRELENILERALTLCESDMITTADLALPTTSLLDVDTADSDVNMCFGEETLDAYLSRLEIETIRVALHQARCNKTAAARFLGIRLGALRYRMQKLQME